MLPRGRVPHEQHTDRELTYISSAYLPSRNRYEDLLPKAAKLYFSGILQKFTEISGTYSTLKDISAISPKILSVFKLIR